MTAPLPVPKWDVDTVCGFLTQIGLSPLTEAFKTNAVNGSDLIGLADADFKESLGCTPLQTKKIRKELEAYGIHAGGDAAAAAPVASAPVPEAAVAASAPPAPEATPKDAPAPAPTGADKAAQLQSEIAQMSARAGEVQRGTVSYSTAQQHLRRAEQELGSALKSLTVTQISGATETIQDMRIGMRGGGVFGRNRGVGRQMDRRNDFGHNMIDTITISKANNLMKAAAGEISQAKQHVPQLPFIQSANVSQAMGGVFFSALLAPGLIGDMMQNAKVNKAKAQVQEMANQVKQALDWCGNNMNAANAEMAQLNGSLQMKQSELASLAC
ncbi:hypothetical protein Ndes2526B_g02455 [Nannochloris sp. 'desiccata']|nr:hypothetical protein NADE_004248 [Chlorella desiccata (nom. nud.)]